MKKKYKIVAILLFLGLFFSGCDKKPECMKEVVAFDKIESKKILNQQYQDFLQKGGKFESKIEYPEYMSSLIKGKITTESVDEVVKKYIKESNSDYKIKYTIIENDKMDPKKKTQKCKLFAGYLLFEFFYKDTRFYKIQIDFMQTDGSDIEKRVKCMMKMFEYKYNSL
jgi:PBP1b-binding outer membrane lipoprotein LpoB